MNSVLDSVKDYLGISPDILVFDSTIKMHINNSFVILHQIGVGPTEGFVIQSNVETWDDYTPTKFDQEAVKNYIYMKVKVSFDPPTSSFVLTSLENQIRELEWRLKVKSETP